MSARRIASRAPFTALLLSLIALHIAGCSGTAPGRPGAGARTSRELLLVNEIDRSHRNAYDAIARLRPEFLHVQGRNLDRIAPVAYLDGARLAGVELLQGVPVEWIASIRWMRPSQATGRYGADHASGAIFVTTKQRRRAAR